MPHGGSPMNKIYKVKYNAQTGQYTAVSEMAKSAGKTGRVLAVVSTLLATTAVQAAIVAKTDLPNGNS